MADYFIAAVRLDPLETPATDALASALEDWLSRDGLIAPNCRHDEVMQPSLWMPGPRWHTVVDDPDSVSDFTTFANNGVDIVREREVHHPYQNAEPPRCPTCSAVMDEDAYYAPIDSWLAGAEPTATCERCGATALLGDWPNDWGYAIGAPAVVFNNWPLLQDTFLQSLRIHLGGRAYIVRGRI